MKRVGPLFAGVVTLALVAASCARPRARCRYDARPRRRRFPSRPRPARTTPPGKLTPANFHSPKLRGWINDVPDTGQFLADSVWILRVGPRVTTVGDFVREWFASYPEYRPGQDSTGRVKFLTSLMNKDIMALTALALEPPAQLRGPARRARDAAARAHHRGARAVRGRLGQGERAGGACSCGRTTAGSSTCVTSWSRTGTTAENVRRELISGRITWAAAVKKYSVAKTDLGPDGDIGWLTADKMDPSLAVRVYGLKPGETSQPVQDKDGWHIVQSIERQAARAAGLRGHRATRCASQLRAVRSDERTDELTAMLRLQQGMVYDTANAMFASPSSSRR